MALKQRNYRAGQQCAKHEDDGVWVCAFQQLSIARALARVTAHLTAESFS